MPSIGARYWPSASEVLSCAHGLMARKRVVARLSIRSTWKAGAASSGSSEPVEAEMAAGMAEAKVRKVVEAVVFSEEDLVEHMGTMDDLYSNVVDSARFCLLKGSIFKISYYDH